MTRKWMFAGLLSLLVAASVPILARQNTNPLLRPNALTVNPTVSAVQRFGPSTPAVGYMTMEGTRQGAFKGSASIKGLEGSIPIHRFDYEIISPRDVATGMASGKRQHKPIRIVKEWDASSPMLFQALVSNEQLKNAKFLFYRVNQSGQMENYYTITLTGAAIAGIKQYTGDPSVNLIPRNAQETARYEEISFVFQSIQVENKPGGTVAQDDFSAAR